MDLLEVHSECQINQIRPSYLGQCEPHVNFVSLQTHHLCYVWIEESEGGVERKGRERFN